MRNKNNIIIDKALYTDKFIVYCDKRTVKYSQKWYRYNYINDLYMFAEIKQKENSADHLNKVIDDLRKKNLSKCERKKEKEKEELKMKYKTLSIEIEKKKKKLDSKKIEKESININIEKHKLRDTKKIEEIYTPIEYDEYFFQNNLDPFPLIRTYKHNTHNSKDNSYSFNNYLNNYLYGQNADKKEESIKNDNKNNNSLVLNNKDNNINNINNLNNNINNNMNNNINNNINNNSNNENNNKIIYNKNNK